MGVASTDQSDAWDLLAMDFADQSERSKRGQKQLNIPTGVLQQVSLTKKKEKKIVKIFCDGQRGPSKSEFEQKRSSKSSVTGKRPIKKLTLPGQCVTNPTLLSIAI